MVVMSEPLILVADDDLTSQWVLQVLLRNEGFAVRTVQSGAEALSLARQLDPDLVLLDVQLPDIDGYDVCRRLREDARLGDVPIVLVTTAADRASRLRGIGAGADDFIAKPIDDVELAARVRGLTRLSRHRRALLRRPPVAVVRDRQP